MYELILLFLGVLHVIVSQTCWRSPDTYWSWVGVVTEMLAIGVAVAGIVNTTVLPENHLVLKVVGLA